MCAFIFRRCIIMWLCSGWMECKFCRNQSWDGFPRYLLACGRNQSCKCLFNLAVGAQGGLPFSVCGYLSYSVPELPNATFHEGGARQNARFESHPSHLEAIVQKKTTTTNKQNKKNTQVGIFHTTIRSCGISNNLAQVRLTVCGSEHSQTQPSLVLQMNVRLCHRHSQRKKKKSSV